MLNMLPRILKITRLLCVSFILVLPSYAVAIDSDITFSQHTQLDNSIQWQPVPDAALASLRGGFILPNGVIVDISFEKRIFKNGLETFASFFQTPKNQALLKSREFNAIAGATNSMFQSIIQNDLDNQIIKSLNTINIDIQNLRNATLNLSNHEYYNRFIVPNTHQ